MRAVIVSCLCSALSLSVASYLHAVDCNDNGVEDSQELASAFYTAEVIDLESANGAATGAAGDFDGDGFEDLAATGRLQVLLIMNDGAGNLSPQGKFPGDAAVIGTEAMDVDGDDDLDLVTLNEDSAHVPVFKNDGAAGFTAAGQFSGGFSSGRAATMAGGDLDDDGDSDLNVTTSDAGDPAILWNNGGGELPTRSSLTLGRQQQVVKVSDLNQDGRNDVVVLTYGLVVCLNQGERSFTASAVRRDENYSAESLALGDINGDRHLDVVSAGLDVWIHKNDGRGALTQPTVSSSRDATWGIVLADVDGDADLDAALNHRGDVGAGRPDRKVSLLWNDGLGGLAGESGFIVGDVPWSLLAMGPERDGDPDLVTFNTFSRTATLLRNLGGGRFHATRYFSPSASGRSPLPRATSMAMATRSWPSPTAVLWA